MVSLHPLHLGCLTNRIPEFRYAYNNASGLVADFFELLRHKSSQTAPSLSSLVSVSLRELPEVIYLLRAAEHPASIPVSIASMRLVQETTSSFMSAFMGFLNESGSIAERFHKVRQLYEIENIPNNVVDGNTSFPEDRQSLQSGISVEFRSVFIEPSYYKTPHSFPDRNVSFKYPGSETLALRDVSFKIDKGQLCVCEPLCSTGDDLTSML
jgi:ABC-type multidrug transport system fused ATPase/permease subunit